MMRYSQEAVTIWKLYAEEFEARWGIDMEVASIVGARSKKVFSAEYKERGDAVYSESVLLPIRNAFYSASQIDERWSMLKDMNMQEPILDYGCGVGFQLLWLKRHGFTTLFGYELPGVQYKVMASMFKKNGIKVWDGRKVETVVCLNVLEHVKEPVAMLNELMRVSKRVIANIDLSDDGPHVAPHAELEKCRAILESKESLYRAA